ncbi:18202_t:CDS:2, partial [Funneliformis geosporum]
TKITRSEEAGYMQGAREKLCREILTEYLGSPSLIRRPEFLKTQEHLNGLELDIFYPQYGFAIEVQGIQHEKYHEFFHKGDPNNFIRQQARDQLKKEFCEKNWIALRYVWYYEDPYLRFLTLEQYLLYL